MSRKKICIICPYFGSFPDYIDFTFKSMNNNCFIQWIIFTDNNCEKYNYNNIKFIHHSFQGMKKKIKSKIGTEISLVYKLCDYKPLYGLLFEEYLEKYDFWGYCDLDVIFGDLKLCFSDYMLETYDKIFEMGHLSIYKNNKEINKALYTINDYGFSYKAILNSDYIYVTDESFTNHIGINELLERKGYRVYRDHDLFMDTKKQYRNIHYLKGRYNQYYYFLYQNKKLYMKNYYTDICMEYAYVHFQKRSFSQIVTNNTDEFIIVPKGFYDKDNLDLHKYYKIFDKKIFWYVKYRIQRKLTNMKNRDF